VPREYSTKLSIQSNFQVYQKGKVIKDLMLKKMHTS